MLIAEDLLLLITDDDSGKTSHVSFADTLISAALLADLTMGGYVRITEKGESAKRGRVVVDPQAGVPQHPVLAATLRAVAQKDGGRPGDLVYSLSTKGLVGELYEGLARAEIVRRDDKSFLGFIKWKNWPTVSPEHELTIRSELVRILLTEADADVHQASLIAILGAEDAIDKVLLAGQTYDRKRVRARVKELRTQFWPADAAYQTIQQAIAAMVVVTTAAH